MDQLEKEAFYNSIISETPLYNSTSSETPNMGFSVSSQQTEQQIGPDPYFKSIFDENHMLQRIPKDISKKNQPIHKN